MRTHRDRTINRTPKGQSTTPKSAPRWMRRQWYLRARGYYARQLLPKLSEAAWRRKQAEKQAEKRAKEAAERAAAKTKKKTA